MLPTNGLWYTGGHETSRATAALEQRRRKAVELLQQKMMIVDVAAAVQASTSSVKRWRDAYEAQGDAGLNSIPHDRPLAAAERKTTTTADPTLLLKALGPAATANDLWTCPRVAEVIQRLFGVTLPRGPHRHAAAQAWAGACKSRSGEPASGTRRRSPNGGRQEWPRIKKGSRAKS